MCKELELEVGYRSDMTAYIVQIFSLQFRLNLVQIALIAVPHKSKKTRSIDA